MVNEDAIYDLDELNMKLERTDETFMDTNLVSYNMWYRK